MKLKRLFALWPQGLAALIGITIGVLLNDKMSVDEKTVWILAFPIGVTMVLWFSIEIVLAMRSLVRR